MKALILNNKIVQIADKEFPVAPSLKWVDCEDDVTTKHGYNKGKFSEPEPEIQEQLDETEVLIQQEIRNLAISSLQQAGKLK